MAEGTKQNSNTSTKKHIASARKNLQPANNMTKGAQIADYVLFIATSLQASSQSCFSVWAAGKVGPLCKSEISYK